MSTPGISNQPSFGDLIFSDLARYRPEAGRSWLRLAALCLTTPGMIASLIVRAQQCLFRSGHVRLAAILRTVGIVFISADFGPGMNIGKGIMFVHPVGVTIGYGVRIGDNVTFAAGVTAAARYYQEHDDQRFATIGDNVILGAHAVMVGGVHIGDGAVIGANAVVLSDVPEGAVVFGSPARRVGTRDDGIAS